MINLLVLFLILFSSWDIFAQDNSISKVDSTHDAISKSIFRVTNKIDSYFGNKRALEENNGSNLRIYYLGTIKEKALPRWEPNLKLNIRFRELENKLNFKIERKSDEVDLTNRKAQGPIEKTTVDETKPYQASIGISSSKKRFWHTSIDTGVKIETGFTPFVRARGRRSFYQDKNEYRLTEEVLLNAKDGLFQFTDIDLYRPLNKTFTFRFANRFVWTNELNELVTTHGPSLYQIISKSKAIAYNFRTTFINRPVYNIVGHDIYAVYRQLLYRKWFFFELTPGISYLKALQFEQTAYFSAKLEAVFGNF